MADDTYDVFVSHSRADGRHPAEIDSFLRDNDLKSFFDRRNLDPGLPRVRALEKAIGAANSAIVLNGPLGFGNTQQYERDLALIRPTHDPAFPVVLVILPDAQRKAFFLPPEPPRWCIQLEKWPYHTEAWKQWLKETGTSKNPPLPTAP